MIWIPNLSIVLQVFDLLKILPECKDLEQAVCINPNGITGILDKIKYGLPYKEINIWERAAILVEDLVTYHYFSDGNKRISFIMLMLFLSKNNYSLIASEDEKVEFILTIAQNQLRTNEIAIWINNHCKTD